MFVIAFVCVCVAFVTPSWIVSDYRITGAKLERLGLWTHCFRSLPDVNDDYQRRFFVGCRWVFDPFTAGYDEIRGFLIPRKIALAHFVQSQVRNFPSPLHSIHDSHAIFLHALLHFGRHRVRIGAVLLPVRGTRPEVLRQNDRAENRWL